MHRIVFLLDGYVRISSSSSAVVVAPQIFTLLLLLMVLLLLLLLFILLFIHKCSFSHSDAVDHITAYALTQRYFLRFNLYAQYKCERKKEWKRWKKLHRPDHILQWPDYTYCIEIDQGRRRNKRPTKGTVTTTTTKQRRRSYNKCREPWRELCSV